MFPPKYRRAIKGGRTLGSVHISSVRKDFERKSALARRKAQQGWTPCEHFQRSRRVFEPKYCRVMKCEQTSNPTAKCQLRRLLHPLPQTLPIWAAAPASNARKAAHRYASLGTNRADAALAAARFAAAGRTTCRSPAPSTPPEKTHKKKEYSAWGASPHRPANACAKNRPEDCLCG